MKVSVIIPVYNEERWIGSCLESLSKQTYKQLEIIVVDDGSNDKSKDKVQNAKIELKNKNLILLSQDHLGPGAARNHGASRAKGEILVFVDADMEFEGDFIEKLIEPILKGKASGTFSKEEYLLNRDNVWARCWNLNLGRRAEKMHPDNYPDTQHVFRAILKSSFGKVNGFDTKTGYTDDWSLANKLGLMAIKAPGAKFYHRNPETLMEVWEQARWYGKNEFLTGNYLRKLYNLIRYFPPASVFKGVIGIITYNETGFFIFKIIFDSAVFVSVLKSFFNEHKNK